MTRAGTFEYMAPEVLVCPRKAHPQENKERCDLQYGFGADIWALGVLAYELLVGRVPYGGERKGLLQVFTDPLLVMRKHLVDDKGSC